MIGVENYDETTQFWMSVCDCVRSHMGVWGRIRPQTEESKIFHLADVAVSTKGLVNLTHKRDVIGADIEDYSVPDLVGKREHFREEDGVTIFNFGKKWIDTPLDEVVAKNPGYLRWMLKQGAQSYDNPRGFPTDVIERVKGALEAMTVAKQNDMLFPVRND